MWGDQMQLQITANMHNVNVNVLKVSSTGSASVRQIKPDQRLRNQANPDTSADIWLILQGEHYDSLVNGNNPLVKKDIKMNDNKEKTEETEDSDTDHEEDESEKDTLIKKLRSDLKLQEKGMKSLQELYKGCEKEIKKLQEENERWKIQVKDANEYVQLTEAEQTYKDKSKGNESDDEGSDNWKTIPKKQKSKRQFQSKKAAEAEISCSICGQYVLTESELKAHIFRCHEHQDNCGECDFQASSKEILANHLNVKHNKNLKNGDQIL